MYVTQNQRGRGTERERERPRRGVQPASHSPVLNEALALLVVLRNICSSLAGVVRIASQCHRLDVAGGGAVGVDAAAVEAAAVRLALATAAI